MDKNSNDLIIRQASIKDAGDILDIYNDAILNTTAVYSYEPHTINMRLEWLEEKKRNNIPVFVAEADGKVAGFASYGPFRAWAAYQYTIEHSVYVHKSYRQQGIAGKLLVHLIETVKQKQVHTIIAGIDANNIASISLHQKLGFAEIGTFKQVGYKFNNWLDLKFMQLILDNDFKPDN
ncbi:GNAT family N-acetyltransferase [Mucilaginibacter ginsenosidivorax]|uniref:GNAT family N-acetyltransferase n=1 Tax=Mucilaginibacter ginsenosidivorax TaxID=862126 RepID=UPI001CEFA0C4|nr:GNAT family N-acetyltransferase [Mucilaginibacter ginsenosidivorax]